MDKAWKRHEREVAEYFGTRRALHGLDRGMGEVHTDIFVDVEDWLRGLGYFEETEGRGLWDKIGMVVECKHSAKTSGSNHSWPVKLLGKIKAEIKKDFPEVHPLVITKDEWAIAQIESMPLIWQHILGDQLVMNGHRFVPPEYFEVRHVNKKMGKFFQDAYAQAKTAQAPEGYEQKNLIHIVCVGSNARLPKVVMFPLEG